MDHPAEADLVLLISQNAVFHPGVIGAVLDPRAIYSQSRIAFATFNHKNVLL
jgi:hypothetical protein